MSIDAVKQKAASKILPYVKSIENGTLRGPISLHLLITDYCVNVCNMCLHHQTENKKIMSLDTLSKIWQEMNENDGESICLTGGDPVRHPKFNEILKLERKFDLGFVNTGNYNKKTFDWELLHGVKWIRYSIDSLSNDNYKIIRSRDNLWDEIIPNIRRSKEYVKEIGINFTIQNVNAHETIDMIKFCVDEGIYRLIMYPIHDVGNANSIGMNKEQEKQLLNDLVDTEHLWKQIPENNAQFLIENLRKSVDDSKDIIETAFDFKEFDKHPCMIHKTHLSIGADGTVFPCEVIASDIQAYQQRDFWVEFTHDKYNHYQRVENKEIIHSLGNVNEESLINIWERNYNNSFRGEECKYCWSRYRPVIEAYHEAKGKKIFI